MKSFVIHVMSLYKNSSILQNLMFYVLLRRNLETLKVFFAVDENGMIFHNNSSNNSLVGTLNCTFRC